ncbi:sulfatase-like hydrolase/transferase [bacterium]
MMSKKLKRRDFIKTTSAGAAGLVMSNIIGCNTQSERPNILWLTSEDNGPFLGCYGDSNAHTPNLDQLASEGILFTQAFANAPVCAPARNTIITGMYASSLGTQHMRSQRSVPNSISFFPQLLRQAGYYCTNNAKEDYNVEQKPEDVWDESSRQATYKNRQPGQPFFAVFNHTVCHESSLHQTTDVQHDPDQMRLPEYHPDDPIIRHDWAQYYDRVTEMDRQVGEKLKELEAEGLLENTIIFYYADHGGVPTRSKRFLYDSGIHVPMIVRFPKKYQHLAPSSPGTHSDHLVSFVDLAPTILSLTDIPMPSHMQGNAFLGRQRSKPQDYIYCFRDRMDERYDLMRSVRDHQFKYIHNYMPHFIYGQHLEYLWRMPTTRQWESLYKQGKCNGTQRYFWETKPVEELYDTVNDPDEVNNLAEVSKYQETLIRMRQALDDWLEDIQDTGFMPEGEMIKRAEGTSVYEMIRKTKKYDFIKSKQAAETASLGKVENLSILKKNIHDDDPVIRYWGVVGCLILGELAKSTLPDLEMVLDDSCPDVQIVTAEFMARFGDPKKALSVLKTLMNHDIEAVRLRAANTIDYLDEIANPLIPQMREKISDASEDVRKVMAKALADFGEGD